MPDPTLCFNYLDDLTSYLNSVSGANGTATTGSPSFAANKFNSGIQHYSATQAASVGFKITFPTEFTIEYWVKALVNSATSVSFSEGFGNYVFWVYSNSATQITVIFYDAGIITRYVFNFSYSSGDQFHMAYVCNNAGADKIRIFKDGVEATIVSKTNDFAWDGLQEMDFFLSSITSAKFNFDNLRIYNTEKTDFTDRFWQDGAGVPVNIAATQGTETDKVTITWDAVVGDLTGYRVYRSETSGGSFSDISGLIAAGETYDDTTAVSGTHYFYKVRSETSTAESALSTETEGWWILAFDKIEDVLIPRVPKVLITDNEIDIYDLGYCTNFISVTSQKTFQRDKVVSDSFDFEVLNSDNFFSVDNPVSPLYGLHAFQPIKFIDSSGETVFEGVIENIIRDHNSKTAVIKTTDSLYQYAKTNVEYVSADWETPASAFINICSAIGFTGYDTRSVDIADAKYVLAGCYLKLDYDVDNPIQFQNLIEELGRVGVADIYSMGGKIYFKHWQEYSETPPYVITADDLMEFPVIMSLTEEMVNDYSVGYDGDGGTPAIDSANGDIGALSREKYGARSYEAFETTTGDIILKDLTSAVYIGECLIRRSHYALSTNPRPLNQIDFSLNMDTGNWIDIDTFFSLTFSDEAWTIKTFEVMSIDKNEDSNTIKITAYEIP